MAKIEVRNLRKQFGESFVAVQDSTFTIADTEFFVLLGPSGCGKTTTLRMIAGLEFPSSGEILLDGEDVTLRRAAHRDIAFMFQLFALYPHMNVRSNIAFPLKCQGVPRAERKRRVEQTAALLRIDHLLDQPVSGLAGGDRQRVSLGRAIVREPKAFLMDEPLGALDTEFRELMCGELRTLHNRMKATTVYVTHDQLEAMSMADRIMVMNHGIIEQVGTPQTIYDRPASMYVADFIGSPSMGFLDFEAAVEAGQSTIAINGAQVEVPMLRVSRAAGPLSLGVRPEHVSFSEHSKLRGSVFGTEYLGTTQVVTVDTEHGQLRARVSSSLDVRAGENVGLECMSDRLVVFDRDSGKALHSDLFEGLNDG
jgi:multiple sugar transport system ATP-binding protein